MEVVLLDTNICLVPKSHGVSYNLDIPDSLIASTALVKGYKLFTYNIKDFRFIDNLELIKNP